MYKNKHIWSCFVHIALFLWLYNIEVPNAVGQVLTSTLSVLSPCFTKSSDGHSSQMIDTCNTGGYAV